MPPRNVAVGGGAKARVIQGGATHKAVPPARAFILEAKEEITECPLCVEPLDQTDQAFQPCPCGYLVCLFCYHKLKDLCNGLCPGCRREYGAALPVEVSVVTDVVVGTRDIEPATRSAHAPSHHPAPPAGARAGAGLAGGGNVLDPQHNAAGTAAATAAARAAQAATAATTARPVAQPGGVPVVARRADSGALGPGRGGRAGGDDATALPSGATWATQAGQRFVPEAPAVPPAPPAAPAIADVSAWPDLAAAQAAPPPQPVRAPPRERAAGPGENTAAPQIPAAHQAQQQHQPPLQQHAQHHRASSNNGASGGNATMPANAMAQPSHQQERMSCMTQDPVVSPEQLGIPPGIGGIPSMLAGVGYQSVQVNTNVFGTQRTIGVTLTNGQQPPDLHPEAQALRQHLEKAVHAGTVTSQQASSQLLALLQQQDRQPQRPPPGFANGPPLHQGYNGHANGNGFLLSANDSQVSPIGRMQPIGTPIGPPAGQQYPQQQQQPPGLSHHASGNGRYANGVSKPTPGMYNLWSGALPSIDFGGCTVQGKQSNAPLSFQPWAAGNGPAGANNGVDNMHAGSLSMAGMGFNGFHGPGILQQQGGPAKPPPPGFAPVPQAYNTPQVLQPNGMQDPVAAAPHAHGEQGGGWYQAMHGSASFSFNNQAPGMPNAARGPPPGMSAYRPQQLGTGA